MRRYIIAGLIALDSSLLFGTLAYGTVQHATKFINIYKKNRFEQLPRWQRFKHK